MGADATKSKPDWIPPTEEEESIRWFLSHAEAGRIDACRQFLDRGTPVDVRNAEQETALLQSVLRNRFETAFFLIEKGADIHAKTMEGDTVLHRIDGWSTQDVGRLIGLGADVNATNGTGTTPLMNTGNADIARLFLEHGADPNAVHQLGQCPVINASWSRNFKLLEVLAEFDADLNVTHMRLPFTSPNSLDRAMMKEDVELACMLLALGAKPTFGRNRRWHSIMRLPPLHAAALGGHLDVARKLVMAGYDPLKTHRRKTPSKLARTSSGDNQRRVAAWLDSEVALRTMKSVVDKSKFAFFHSS